jgi:DNA-binding transcriptional regulator YiaG
VRFAVEQFGSIAHFATAMGVSRERMDAWLSGREEISEQDHARMQEVVRQK